MAALLEQPGVQRVTQREGADELVGAVGDPEEGAVHPVLAARGRRVALREPGGDERRAALPRRTSARSGPRGRSRACSSLAELGMAAAQPRAADVGDDEGGHRPIPSAAPTIATGYRDPTGTCSRIARMAGYVQDDMTAEEVARQKALYGPFTQAVRELVDAAIRTEVDDDEVRAVQAEVEAWSRGCGRSQIDGRTACGSAPAAAVGRGATPWSGLRNADRAAAGDRARGHRPRVVGLPPRGGVRRPARAGARRRLRADPRPDAR